MFGKARREDAEPLPAILVSLLIWPLLKVPSIHSFCSELCHFLQGRREDGDRKHDILYGVLRREDVNWRNLSGSLSKKVAAQNELGPVERRAFVIDDSIKTRRGRRSKAPPVTGITPKGARFAGSRWSSWNCR
ncbi:MAG: hypothetical protein R3F19_18190 [Verrucomicrobiales bacterium]